MPLVSPIGLYNWPPVCLRNFGIGVGTSDRVMGNLSYGRLGSQSIVNVVGLVRGISVDRFCYFFILMLTAILGCFLVGGLAISWTLIKLHIFR